MQYNLKSKVRILKFITKCYKWDILNQIFKISLKGIHTSMSKRSMGFLHVVASS